MVPGLLAAHLAGDGEAVVLAVLVVALDVEVGEVDGDPPLGRGNDLPDAVLVAVNNDDDDDDDYYDSGGDDYENIARIANAVQCHN